MLPFSKKKEEEEEVWERFTIGVFRICGLHPDNVRALTHDRFL